jgi:plasmid stabilization system protein ParE
VTVRSVRLAPAARGDLVRLIDFLSSKSRPAATKASEAIVQAVRSLGEFSDRGRPGKREHWRELIVRFGRSAYIVQYRVYPSAVLVTRIFHNRENR